MKSIEVKFGIVLKELRNKKGLTQEDLAIQSDLDRTYISLLERGLRQPTISTLFKIAEVLEVTPSSIIKKLEE
ncbi:helix-turn-helix domain-containing protein [Ohtaekwangia sp.]|uniref:helix-turn-helix domain-containing protein n=1 Tax=Ohtaekwangia sp. TaxID=2066019 RepID=UPI002FDD2A85